MNAAGIAKGIASVTTFHRNDKNREHVSSRVTRTTGKTRTRDKTYPQETKRKTKILRKTQFSKIKTHLKLSSKSVGQGRGGLEGTVRPSQLRAGSPPKENNCKKNKSSRETKPARMTKHTHKRQNEKLKSLANNIFKNQNSLKIKLQERRPRKGRLGGDRAAFATPSRVPSKEKNIKEKIKSSRETKPARVTRTAGKN
ncbi:MAG: hypothetical protein J6A06_07165 [Fibrobacteraceae bacterium]|nr:hypothetical protein [Fibrobacteraceae bacterium]